MNNVHTCTYMYVYLSHSVSIDIFTKLCYLRILNNDFNKNVLPHSLRLAHLGILWCQTVAVCEDMDKWDRLQEE